MWIGPGVSPGAWRKSYSKLLEGFQGKAVKDLWVWLGSRQVCLCTLNTVFLSLHSGQWSVLRREWDSLNLGTWSPAHSHICIHKLMMDKPQEQAIVSEISLQSAANFQNHMIKRETSKMWPNLINNCVLQPHCISQTWFPGVSRRTFQVKAKRCSIVNPLENNKVLDSS